MAEKWRFYGRRVEIEEIRKVLSAGRWFFCSISGRRRIGKTSLIREALRLGSRPREVFYLQVPDSDERGVVQAFQDALEDRYDTEKNFDDLRTFADMAEYIEGLCETGSIVVLDEFQYFHRKALAPFASFLQTKVDRLRDTPAGGLFVLGSIHTEMTAILEDRASPLFNRLTHRIELNHWDFETLFEMFEAHGVIDEQHQLFLWALFEGVPKFYRDCFEAGVLRPTPDYRAATLERLFFGGTSPLRDEADNWFLRELRGRYDSVLKLLANKGPCSNAELEAEYRKAGPGSEKQLGGYLKILIEKYRMLERLQPVFSTRQARKGRYYITDNFLAAWLGALARNVQRARVVPVADAVRRADEMLKPHEGIAFEKMIRLLTEECSRKAVGDFPVTEIVRGYWNKPDGSDIEIDLVARDDDRKIIRFGSCKRSAREHDRAAREAFMNHIQRFLTTKEGHRVVEWIQQHVLYAPAFHPGQRRAATGAGFQCLDLADFHDFLRVH